MSLVYGNAIVNIEAAAARDSEQGFLQARESPVDLSPITGVNEPGEVSVWIGSAPFYMDLREQDSTESRAWCFQESILPSRILNYGLREVHFRCRMHQRLERTPMKDSPAAIFLRFRHIIMKFPAMIHEYDKTPHQYRNIMDSWYYIVEKYSRRSLTFSKDKLPAISGIASLLGEAIHERYLAGLWESELPLALCWYPELLERHPKNDSYTAPSWSWASCAGSIHTYGFIVSGLYGVGRVPTWEAIVLGCGIDPVSDLYGQVRGGYLKVAGRMLKASASSLIFENDRENFNEFSLNFGVAQSKFKSDHDLPPGLGIDDWGLWCMLLGVDEYTPYPGASTLKYLLILVVRQAEGGKEDVFERVGFLKPHMDDTVFDGAERRQITLI